MEPIISIQNMSIYFDASKSGKKKKVGALVDVSLDINPGEIVAIVGESGCGKTTIGKAIVGVHKPTSGKILYNGKDIQTLNHDEFNEYRMSVQMVHQDSYAALNPMKTIFKSLCEPVLKHKMAKTRKEAIEVLASLFEMVGLTPVEHFLFKYPHQLSGGQRQRVLLARALSLKPKIIVADEPVSMVDVSLRISLLDLMSKMNRELGVAFVYITHDLATARYIANNGRMVVTYLGKIVEEGDLTKVLEEPKHPYLQALLSAVPIPDPKISRYMNELPLRSLDMPSAISPPDGCRFHPRCIYYSQQCEKVSPELREYKGQRVSCHNVEKVKDWSWVK